MEDADHSPCELSSSKYQKRKLSWITSELIISIIFISISLLDAFGFFAYHVGKTVLIDESKLSLYLSTFLPLFNLSRIQLPSATRDVLNREPLQNTS